MSIDLYFIGNCKEFMTYPKVYPISYGWGIEKDKKLRRPKDYNPNLPIVIDDSIAVITENRIILELTTYCQKGCILDLERPYSRFHQELFRVLEEKKIHPIWIPPEYKKIGKAFALHKSNKIPTGGFWNTIPYKSQNHTIPLKAKANDTYQRLFA